MRFLAFPRRRMPLVCALTRGALFFYLATAAFAQLPLIYNRSIYNAASYMPSGVPDGAIARGSIFTFFGSNIGPSTPLTANTYPVGATLGGVSINIIQNGASTPALPIYVSATQVNAIMPSGAPLGMASI